MGIYAMIRAVPLLPFRLRVGFKALAQLGPRSIILYTRYQLGLRSGWYLLLSGPGLVRQVDRTLQSHPQVHLDLNLIPLPSTNDLSQVLGETGRGLLLAEADDILQGRASLFGGESVSLQLAPAPPLSHWTFYARRLDAAQDIKLTWEPARFGWGIILARAYRLSADERYPAAFWEFTQRFMDANPPYLGPNWASAQEVALRLISLVFAIQVFAASPESTTGRLSWLAQVVALHAARLPLTLAYARAQNNNHLLSEAAGLVTAAMALPLHPASRGWFNLGWRWFTAACQSQFDPDGAYIQHSANYQRLALQLAMWVNTLFRHADPSLDPSPVGQAFPLPKSQHHLSSASTSIAPPTFHPDLQERLSSATRWLLDLHDPYSGRLPNLGPNDGALLLPLSTTPIGDYRPTLQTASAAFLDRHPFPPGPWDEALLWLGLANHVGHAFSLPPSSAGQTSSLPASPAAQASSSPLSSRTPHILRSPDGLSWAYLRLARFTSRPAHADQLHLDLWWRGHNLAQDAGNFLYNAPPPWDNSLVSAHHHNTLTVDGWDQMLRAGRFLYLDWAQAWMLTRSDCTLTAEHNGYRRLGLLHRRTVSVTSDAWHVQDVLLPQPDFKPAIHRACLHWLLPDWEFSVLNDMVPGNPAARINLQLTSPHGQLQVSLSPGQSGLQITRAGQLLYGAGPVPTSGQEPVPTTGQGPVPTSGQGAASPTWGWVSPTYAMKVPALSVRLWQAAVPPISFTTVFTLPG